MNSLMMMDIIGMEKTLMSEVNKRKEYAMSKKLKIGDAALAEKDGKMMVGTITARVRHKGRTLYWVSDGWYKGEEITVHCRKK